MFGIETEVRDVQALIVSGPGEPPIDQLAPGSSLMKVHNGVVTAQRVAVPRDPGRVLQQIGVLAPVAGTDWYYSIPFKDRKNNRTTYVEGLSIKGAMEVVRIFGNCQVECTVEDVGHSWVFYARFTDYETGFTLVRPFQARKSAADQAMKDRERAMDIAFQIGASKAMRNVVTNALQSFCAHAFESAKKSLVDRIEKDVERYRAMAAEAFTMAGIDISRVERVRGKAFNSWSARDLALISGEISSIKDGMAAWDDIYPALEAGNGEDPSEAATAPKKAAKPAPKAKPAAPKKEEPEPESEQPTEETATEADTAEQPDSAADESEEEAEEEEEEDAGSDWDAWLETYEQDIDQCETVIDVNSHFAGAGTTLAKAPEGVTNRAKAIKDARIGELKGGQR